MLSTGLDVCCCTPVHKLWTTCVCRNNPTLVQAPVGPCSIGVNGNGSPTSRVACGPIVHLVTIEQQKTAHLVRFLLLGIVSKCLHIIEGFYVTLHQLGAGFTPRGAQLPACKVLTVNDNLEAEGAIGKVHEVLQINRKRNRERCRCPDIPRYCSDAPSLR